MFTKIGMPTGSEVGRLVEQQMRNWELAKSQRIAFGPRARAQVQDFICISREVGVGVEEVSALVGKRLGWPVFDKELLHAMAGDDTIREEIYASMDERDLGWCEETLRSFLDPKSIKTDYFHRLISTLLSLARQGSAVFVGRNADLVLPADTGLRVRIVEPLEMRIKSTAQRLGVSDAQARREVEKLQAEREHFIRKHFRTDEHDTRRFDLIINLSRFSPTGAAELILSARALLAAKPASPGP